MPCCQLHMLKACIWTRENHRRTLNPSPCLTWGRGGERKGKENCVKKLLTFIWQIWTLQQNKIGRLFKYLELQNVRANFNAALIPESMLFFTKVSIVYVVSGEIDYKNTGVVLPSVWPCTLALAWYCPYVGPWANKINLFNKAMWNHAPHVKTWTHLARAWTQPEPRVLQLGSHTWFQHVMQLRFLMSHHSKNSVRDKVMGKKWM